MNLDQGQRTLPSKMGTINSFLLLIILFAYTYYKFNIITYKKDVDIVSAVKENHFKPDYIFNAEKGLNIAIAVFTGFDPSSFKQLDEAYGRIRFQKWKWGPNANGEFI